MNAKLESDCRAAIEAKRPGSMLACILVAGFAYYQKDVSLLEDTTFDLACKELLPLWDTFEHPHKHLVRPEDLTAGTLFAIPERAYPTIVKVAAFNLMQ